MVKQTHNSLQDYGEEQILQQLQQFCPATVVGDDGAVFGMPLGKSLVVTTDVLVDGVHFSDRTMPPERLGWRTVAVNLSDLAAMGADPMAISVGLSLPPDTSMPWLEQLYTGMAECLKEYGCLLSGGDLTRSSVKTIGITAWGSVEPEQIIHRGGARVGDVIVATGCHGNSRAGLELLLNPHQSTSLNNSDRQALVTAHQLPRPRFDVIHYLRQHLQPWAIAGMDSSDGLADAVVQLCQASGVGATLWSDRLPISAALRRYQTAQIALEWALYGGEDFELVLCLERSLAIQLQQHIGLDCCIIGEIIPSSQVQLLAPDGSVETLSRRNGFQHF